MKTTAFYTLLARGRKHLNCIIICTETAKLLARTGALIGITVFVAKLLGLRDAFSIWVILTLTGGAAGFVIGLRHALDITEIAFWLDRYLKLKEVLSSALVCLGRNCTGLFDKIIVEQAETVAGEIRSIRWPRRELNRQIISVVIIVIIFTPVTRWQLAHENSINLQPDALLRPEVERLDESSDNKQIPSPGTLARMLFPNDPQLAEKVEKALIEGSQEALESALNELETAGAHGSEEQPNGISPEDKQRLREYLNSRIQDDSNAQNSQEGKRDDSGRRDNGSGRDPSYENVEDGQNNTKNRNTEKNKSNSTNSEKNNGRVNSEQNGDRSKESDEGDKRLEEESTTTQKDLSGESEGKDIKNTSGEQGSEPGTGKGSEDGDWGSVENRTNEKVVLNENRDSQFFEYILSGKNAGVQSSEFAPYLERAAEAALSAEEIPVEYEEFIKSYFQQLTEEISGQE